MDANINEPFDITDLVTEPNVLSVSQLNLQARQLLESSFLNIWVEGEISNFVCPASGHYYFSLKDDSAHVRCAMFKFKQRGMGFTPENGQQVLVKAKVSLYEGRGDFQLIVDHLEESGLGALHRQFEATKKRLDQAGLFSPEHKKSIPVLPQQIGIITSATGAALRDILTTLKRRFPLVPVLIYPTLVQGDAAAHSISKMIELADTQQRCDVLILARGGGSLEDLWAFNEESLAQTIYHCNTAIISGIGHEIDFTIADFVADLRAATPTAAAEAATPDMDESRTDLLRFIKQLTSNIRNTLDNHTHRTNWLIGRLNQLHPGQKLQKRAQRLDELEQRLHTLWKNAVSTTNNKLKILKQRFDQQPPLSTINTHKIRLNDIFRRLETGQVHSLNNYQQRLATLSRALNVISPLSTLSRGYALVTRADNNSIVINENQLSPGDKINARLATGQVHCQVITHDE